MSVSVGPQQREEVRLLTSEASHQTPATATLSLSSLQVQHETRGVTYTAMRLIKGLISNLQGRRDQYHWFTTNYFIHKDTLI